jgi:ASC-1-like (ASCH) protein
MHITPNVEQTYALQQKGWRLDAAMPAAYHQERITQQWSCDLSGEDFMRMMRVKQHFFNAIKDGTKTLEVRVAYESIKTIQIGERIRLACYESSQVVKVLDIRRYGSFEEMLAREEPARIVPTASRAEVLHLLREIYPSHKEALGVVVLELRPEPKSV